MSSEDSEEKPFRTLFSWDIQKTQAPLTLTDNDTTLAWLRPASTKYQPMMLCSQTQGLFQGGHFTWEFFIESLQQRPIGAGILAAPFDWGFFGYLGAGKNAWAYDAARGAIVTGTEAIYTGLPSFTDSGVVAVELDLAESGTLTFIVNGEPTPPIPLPPGAAVVGGASLFALGQKITLRHFQARRMDVVSLAKVKERSERESAATVSSHAPPRRASGRLAVTINDIVALAECEAQLTKDSRNLSLLYRRAQFVESLSGSSRERRAQDRVLAAYDDIFEVDPEDRWAWKMRAAYLGRAGRYEEALESLERSGRKDASAWGSKAHYLDELGRFEESLACLREAQALEPQDNFLLGHIGRALAKLKRWEEAIEVIDKALEVNPDYVGARFEKGRCLVWLQRYKEALAIIQDVDAERKLFGTKWLLAYVIFKLGEPEAARQLMDSQVAARLWGHPLDEGGRTVCGIEVEEEFRDMANAVYARYAHLRKE